MRERIERRIGTTLCQRYRLEALLGVGGMAAVYRGRHRNGHRVAVKVLHHDIVVNADLRARFLREGYVANKVDHRGATRVIDDDIAEDGTPFIVMELLEGETLEDRIVRNGGVLDPLEALSYLLQLLDVLQAAHANGVVHRDLKPDNLLLTADGLKVLDFGIASLRDGTSMHTMTGRILGTPLYMAPEQARGESRNVGPQTDLWSVGAIGFRSLTGRYVFEGPSPERIVMASGRLRPDKVAEVAPHLPRGLAAWIDRALEPSLERRFRTATEMLEASGAFELAKSRSRIPVPARRPRHSVSDGLSSDSADRRGSRHSSVHGVLVGLAAAVAISTALFVFSLGPRSIPASRVTAEHEPEVPRELPTPPPRVVDPLPPPSPVQTPVTRGRPPPSCWEPDADGVRHYRASCLAEEAPTPPPALGALTIVCTPKCTQVIDNGAPLGGGHIFNRPVPTGRHVLRLTAGDVTRNLAVEVVAEQTREIKIEMRP